MRRQPRAGGSPGISSGYEPAAQPQPEIEEVPQLTLFAPPGL